MNKTLIQGLNSKTVQAKLNSVDTRPFTYATHFPLKKVNAFNWKTLFAQGGALNVAADIVADHATIQRKKRPIFSTASGELPKIAISRELRRADLKDYQVALALAQDATAVQLVQYWADDVEYCFNGVNAELEYIAWALASNGGRLSFTNQNNAAVATEFDLDYQVGDDQKQTTTVAFSNAATADVIGSFVGAVNAGKAINANIKYAFTSLANFYRIASTDQIRKLCSTLSQNVVGTPVTPGIETVNQVLATQAWLNGLQLVVIDKDITRELADGTRSTGNPFVDNRIVFAESNILGSTQYDILANQDQVILRAERGHTVVKKYSIPEPLTEVTLAEADALSVLDTAYKNIYLRTDATAW